MCRAVGMGKNPINRSHVPGEDTLSRRMQCISSRRRQMCRAVGMGKNPINRSHVPGEDTLSRRLQSRVLLQWHVGRLYDYYSAFNEYQSA